MRSAAIIEGAFPRGGVAILHPVFVKYRLRDGVRWPVVPTRIVIKIKLDRDNCSGPDIGAPPAAAPGQEFSSDFEGRVFHLGNIAPAIPKYYNLERE
jgi:hypothetical protein